VIFSYNGKYIRDVFIGIYIFYIFTDIHIYIYVYVYMYICMYRVFRTNILL